MPDILGDTIKLSITLISVLNPLGAIPVFLALTKNQSDQELRKIATTCSVAVVITILISMAFGEKILHFFGISVASFRVGGGILVGTMALSMLHGKTSNAKISESELQGQNLNEVGIVPLAIPLLAGPGTITTSIIQAQSFVTSIHWVGAILVCAIMGLVVHLILSFARPIAVQIGTVGVNVMTRIMGLLLMALSIEFISAGLKVIFPSLH